jgi:ubiquitin carboxyl-terminal hydrolase 25/28
MLIRCRLIGRQHDVSECMDNCVFQIETALLKFDGLDESEDGKSSVVKRCVALGFSR